MSEFYRPQDTLPHFKLPSLLLELLDYEKQLQPLERFTAIRQEALSIGQPIQLGHGLDLPDPSLAQPLLEVLSTVNLGIRALRKRITVTPEQGCWLMPLSAQCDARGRFRYPRCSTAPLGYPEGIPNSLLSHRYSVIATDGAPYRLGREQYVDHICRDHACCNPTHLEVVTSAVNTRRGVIARRTPNRHDRLPI